MARPRIFIAHRHAYATDFWQLRERMKAEFCFDDLSVHDMKFEGELPPDFLVTTIDRRIRQCNLFIAIGRRATAFGDWCRWEIERASGRERPILCYSPRGMDPGLAPAAARRAPTYRGHFTQVRRLAGIMQGLGLDV